MGRKPGRLSWLKFWIDEILDGSTNRELTPAERGIWFELVLLAGRANKHGKIMASVEDIPRLLNIKKRLFDRVVTKLLSPAVNKLQKDPEGTLIVRNYDKYQPDKRERYDTRKALSESAEQVEKDQKGRFSDQTRRIPKMESGDNSQDKTSPKRTKGTFTDQMSERSQDKDKDKDKEKDARVRARGLAPSPKKNIFEEFPYSQSAAVRDVDYMEIIKIPQKALKDGRKLTPEEGLLVKAAMIWAHYIVKVPHGMEFKHAEKTIKGFLADGLTMTELQQEADRWDGSQRAAIWEVFRPLEEKAKHRQARQASERKGSADREKQKERQREDERILKENQELRERWEKKHPHREFPGLLDPEVIAWANPSIPKEDIQAFNKIFPKQK